MDGRLAVGEMNHKGLRRGEGRKGPIDVLRTA